MARLTRVLLSLAGAAVLCGADVDSLLQAVAGYQYGQSPAAVRELEETVLAAAGKPEAANLEAHLDDALARPNLTRAAVDALCRNLSAIGTARSVPVLARLLERPDSVEMARYALERIPGEAAVAALRAALPKATGSARLGIIDSLGRRKDGASVALLVPLLKSEGDAAAAAAALAAIGTPEAIAGLLQAGNSRVVAEELLRAAEHAPAADAARLYRKLYDGAPGESVRGAALLGLARTAPLSAKPLLAAALRDGPPALRAIAIRQLAADGPALWRDGKALPPAAQVQILTALAERGNPASLPAFQEAAGSTDVRVRAAGLRGLGRAGSADSVPLLAERAATAEGDEQAAARAALGLLPASGVDAAILREIPGAPVKTRVELIRAAGDRAIPGAAAVLLKTAADADRTVRRESIRALRETAGPGDVEAILPLLMSTSDGNERNEYERAAAAAIRRSKDAPVGNAIALYRKSSSPAVRASLLSVFAMVGNPEALPVVREALHSGEPNLERAAIAAMSDWPSPEPSEDLLALARTAASPAQQALAVRGYLKLVQLPADRTPEATAKLLAAAMAAAKRPDEKKLVLGAASKVFCEESLALARAATDDPAVAAEAKLAVQNLERGMSYRRK